jgi:squalene synthase HpnC
MGATPLSASSQLAVQVPAAVATVEQAFAVCERLARTHYENFSLATRLMPRRLRPHFYSVYAYCRGVDDLGDEARGDRLVHLAEWERQLRLCYSGTPTHPYFVALQDTIARFDIPEEPFLKLIEANRRDQRTTRHATYSALLDYCDHSANPVGRIVLYVLGHRDPDLHALSDHTCTALQLTNFWQDVRRDFLIGRIYLPVEDMEGFGVPESDIAAGRATDQFRALLRFEVERAHELFRLGVPLVQRVHGFARVDIALFTAGGIAVLRKIERQGYDVLGRRPALSKWDKSWLFARAYLRARLGLPPPGAGRD